MVPEDPAPGQENRSPGDVRDPAYKRNQEVPQDVCRGRKGQGKKVEGRITAKWARS